MIFYLTIKTDKKLNRVPHIDAIDIILDGEEKHCSWDWTDACLENLEEGYFVHYRFKGVAYSDEHGDDYYANGTVNGNSVIEINKNFWWQEDDNAEIFDFEITDFSDIM